jgi:hypothetical protein
LIGDLSAASFSASCAEVTWSVAVVTAAWSAASCVSEASASWSAASFAWSLASIAFACARLASSAAESTVASTSPASTLSPSATRTLVTLPDTAKFSSSCCAGSIVPVELTDCLTDPILAATRRYGAAAAFESGRNSQ